MKVLYASSLVVLFVYLLRYIRHASVRPMPPRWSTNETVSLSAAVLLTVMLTFAGAFAVQGIAQFASSSAVDETVAIASVVLMVLAVFAPRMLFGRRRSA